MDAAWRVAGALQRLRTQWQQRGSRPIVVVHQMARVGSRSIRKAIGEQAPDLRSFHTHYLNRDTIDRMNALFLRRFRHTGRPGLYREYLHADWLAARIRRGEWGDWRIVTLVRDPLARTVSAFFRHLPLHHPELGEGFRDDPRNVPALIDLFREKGELESDFALTWFDREVRDVFGVDVYERPFTAGAGIECDCEAGRLQVVRTEDLDTSGGEAIGRFLGRGPLALSRENRSADMSYSSTWIAFLAGLRLTGEYLDRMYESKLARHFYGDEEIAAFRSRWTVDA